MKYLRRIPYYTVLGLLIYMPLHVFLSQSLSLLTGGLEVWKVAKDIALALAVLFTICLVFWERKGSRGFWALTGLGAIYGFIHLLIWALHNDIYGRSAVIGLVINMRLPALAVLGYGAYLLTPSKFAFSSVIKVVLAVSSAVSALAIAQRFLPSDLLTHFGYSLERGVRPAFFIDDNPAFPRVMSTLREPNSLAAYLLLPLALLSGFLLEAKKNRRRLLLAGLLGLHLTALYLTQSRSALLAAAVAGALLAAWRYRAGCARLLRRFWPVLAAAAVVLVAAGLVVRNQPFVQGFISHSTPDSTVNDLDSNDYHWLFFRRGIEGIAQDPLGHGPGTAGLASIQNPAGSFLTENYYVQVGYEVGLIGLALFAALNIWVYVKLRQGTGVLFVSLAACFWGYFVMNMLLHIWANEAVAAQWWLLAGAGLAALGPAAALDSKKRRKSL